MKVTTELDRRFRDAAAAAGDLDVGYDMVSTPIGALFVAATPAGLCRISYDPETERVVENLARTVGVRVLRAPRSVDETRRQLDEYFEHRRTDFDLAIDLRVSDGFPRRVLDALARVPYGEVTTYGELARRVEHPRAARAVGTIMNRNPIPIVLPCHRVVGASGSLTGYGGGLDRKEALLRLEGAIL
jgi:methylated-DNA-[protein]-cysteine S-methyltransferase